MTKRIHKIGIAARLTAIVAVILAVFVVPWMVHSFMKMKESAQTIASASAQNRVLDMSAQLDSLGYDPEHMPAADTPKYDLLRSQLISHLDEDRLYVYVYHDEQEETVVLRSALILDFLSGNDECKIDLSDFSETALREMHALFVKNTISSGAFIDMASAFIPNGDYNIQAWGKQIGTKAPNLFFIPNRISINGQEWTALTPVEETVHLQSAQSRQLYWPFATNAYMETYFDAVRELNEWELSMTGKVPDRGIEPVRNADRFRWYSGTMWNDNGVMVSASVIDLKAEFVSWFYRMPFITIALYLIFLFIFYKIVRRMVSAPLVDTAREANLVANLAFDEFKPDLKRRDEIGELNRALSEMAATLHARWDSERDLEDKRQQFVSAASHDLKTPLALIGGYAEAIAQDISPEENARYLAAIEQETDRMNGLVREMLDYTRLDRTDELKNRKTLNLTALVRDMLTEYAPLFEKRRLTADIADGVRIRGDETLLRRAVGCLLENAAKYSPENGRVSVRLTNARNDLLTVENDCEPIPEDELPRLFEMFYRGDKARDRAGGHGLGLAILQKILALHGLTCKAENVKNGVRFIVCNKD